MHYEDYSTLKADSKVAFKEIPAVAEVKEVRDHDGNVTTAGVVSQRAYTVLERKSYDPNTGAESTVEDRLSLSDLERDKDQLTAEKASIQAKLTEVGKMIADIKKL